MSDIPLTREELQQALSEAGGGFRKLSEFVDQALVITGFRIEHGQYKNAQNPEGEYAVIDALTLEGEEVEVASGGTVILPQLKKLAELDAFPVEVVVESFPGQFGKDGYRFEVS